MDISRPVIPDMASFAGIVARHLQTIYKSSFSESMVNRIMALASKQYPVWPPLNEGDTVNGSRKVCTFSNDQIDLNFIHPEVLMEIIRVMIIYVSENARFIRLDARIPETHEIVKLLRDIADFVRPGTIILTEN